MIVDSLNTRAHLEEKLNEIKRKLLKLGKMANEALMKAVWALKNHDIQLARTVIGNDDQIDFLRYEIENDCLTFIARFQPFGEDLRTVSSIMYMAGDIERLGDYGSSISKTAIELANEEFIKPLIDIPRMQELLTDMLEKALSAFDQKDLSLAKTVFKMDDTVDDLEEQILRELVLMMMEKPSRIEQASKLFLVARSLERAGDHITNLSERIFYISTGEMTPASKFRRPLPPDKE